MSFTAKEWTEEYKRSRAFVINLRSSSSAPASSSSSSRQQLANLEQSIDKLDYRLGLMEQNPGQFGVTESEVVRRRELVKGLRTQASVINSSNRSTSAGGGVGAASSSFSGGGVGGGGGMGPRTLAQQRREIISEQDELLEDLGKGVDRLKMKGLTIRDETTMHQKLLDDIDGDVEAAASSLRLEARHAQRLREQSTVCRLYLCIVVLLIVLVVLLVIGFT
ncbi:qc-syp6 tlg1p syntaxin 6 family [Nannochloropsis oceanica]